MQWCGETVCNICGKRIEDTLYDAKTFRGVWATMCQDCFNHYGVGLGSGRGQKYVKNDKGEFEKVMTK